MNTPIHPAGEMQQPCTNDYKECQAHHLGGLRWSFLVMHLPSPKHCIGMIQWIVHISYSKILTLMDTWFTHLPICIMRMELGFTQKWPQQRNGTTNRWVTPDSEWAVEGKSLWLWYWHFWPWRAQCAFTRLASMMEQLFLALSLCLIEPI